MNDNLTWFSTLWQLKASLQSIMNNIFNIIFLFMVEHYERDFDIISHFTDAENLVAEHYEWYFNMIFQFKAA